MGRQPDRSQRSRDSLVPAIRGDGKDFPPGPEEARSILDAFLLLDLRPLIIDPAHAVSAKFGLRSRSRISPDPVGERGSVFEVGIEPSSCTP